MDLLIVDADTEQPDALGRRRVFVRVAAWWNDAHAPQAKPDAVLDFLLHAPEASFAYVEDGHGRRRTTSGVWHPRARVEVAGEWVGEDPADPWERVEVVADPIAQVWPTIVNVARLRHQQGYRGNDTFGDVDRPRLDAARRSRPHGARVRSMIGYRAQVAGGRA